MIDMTIPEWDAWCDRHGLPHASEHRQPPWAERVARANDPRNPQNQEAPNDA